MVRTPINLVLHHQSYVHDHRTHMYIKMHALNTPVGQAYICTSVQACVCVCVYSMCVCACVHMCTCICMLKNT